MATSFLIGSIFELDVDQAEAGLTRLGSLFEGIASTMKETAAQGEALFASLGDSMGRVESVATTMGAAVTGALDRVGSVVSETTARIEGLAAALAAVGRDSAAAGAGRGGGRGSSILPVPGNSIFGEGDDWANARMENANRDAVSDNQRRLAEDENARMDAMAARRAAVSSRWAGHGGSILSGMAPLAEGLGVYSAEKAAMTEDLALRNAAIEGLHIKPEDGPERFEATLQRLREIAQQTARGTIYSEAQVAAAMPTMARELGFTGAEGMEKMASIFRPAMQAAEVAQMSGLGDVRSSLSASIEYAHMTGAYEPAQLEQHLNVLRSIAQLTNQTMHSEETILKYSVPIGMSAGMGADETAMLTGFLQQRGFNSSTAGTGLSAMILGVLNTGGGLSSHLESARSGLEKGLTPDERRQQHGSAHIGALEALHITRGGKLAVVDAKGNLDIDEVIGDIREYARSHTHADVVKTLHDAFNTRGERVAAMFANDESEGQLQRFIDAVQGSPTASQIQGDLAQGTLQQFEQMLSNIANVGNTLATTILPGLDSIFMSVNNDLTGFDEWLKEHQTIATVGGYGLLGGGILGALGLFGLAVRGAATGLGFLTGGLAALVPIETAAVGLGTGLLTLASTVALTTGALGALGLGIKGLWDAFRPPGGSGKDWPAQDWGGHTGSQNTHGAFGGAPPGYGADPEHHLGMAPPPGYGRDAEHHLGTSPAIQTPSISVTIHNVMQGISDADYEGLMKKLVETIKSALATSTTDPAGTSQSAFTYPGMF